MLFENNVTIELISPETFRNDLDSIFNSGQTLGRLVSATETELSDYWKWSGYSDIMSYCTFRTTCLIEGAEIK